MTPPRYQTREIEKIWSESSRLRLWTDIERAHLELLLGRPVLLPAVSEWLADRCEGLVGHDVGGFLLAAEEGLAGDSEAQRWLHFGLTSSDLVDSANAIRVNRTSEHLVDLWSDLLLLLRRDPKFRPEVNGRTHGQVASPTTIQHRWIVAHTAYTREPVPVPVMFSGAVGQYDWVDSRHAAKLADALGQTLCLHTTQVIPRIYFIRALRGWVDWLTACEQIALDVRLMSMTGDVAEPTRAVGSSTMPGKTNPIRAERICGLARLARQMLHAVEEGQALWLDRDLTHSSVDRIAFKEIAGLVAFGLAQTAILLDGLAVHPAPIEYPAADAERLMAEAVQAVDLPRYQNYLRVRAQVHPGPSDGDTNRETSKPGPEEGIQ